MSSDSSSHLNLTFFGLGAVGSAMLICYAELAERDGVQVRFQVFVQQVSTAKDALFHAEHLFERIEFIELPDFSCLWQEDNPYLDKLSSAHLLINAALPAFNLPIMQLALRLGCHSLDLASDMYNQRTDLQMSFDQYQLQQAFIAQGKMAMINFGIAPGVTNFLIALKLYDLLATGRRELEIESISLFLLEDIESDSVVFSWSPLIALEELAQHPRVFRHGSLHRLPPFSEPQHYHFPQQPKASRVYPLYQEELLSLHRAFPEVESLSIYSGGSEVELVKALFQLNLLSKRSLPNQPETTVEAVVRAILPGMNSPRRIEEYLRNGTIARAQFSACAEIRVSETVRNERQRVVETVGLNYSRYRELLGSPYAGATYISYPTAIGAAILSWHALDYHGHQNKQGKTKGEKSAKQQTLVGIVSGEDLAKHLPRQRSDALKRDLVGWDLDLFDSVRDISS